MLQANISTVKNNLSKYLEKVAGGNEVVISDRNTPIAILIPFTPAQHSGNWSSRVAQLAALGHLKNPLGNSKSAEPTKSLEVKGCFPLSECLLQERRSSR
jgi:prevent-host-death family protein